MGTKREGDETARGRNDQLPFNDPVLGWTEHFHWLPIQEIRPDGMARLCKKLPG